MQRLFRITYAQCASIIGSDNLWLIRPNIATAMTLVGLIYNRRGGAVSGSDRQFAGWGPGNQEVLSQESFASLTQDLTNLKESSSMETAFNQLVLLSQSAAR